MTVEERIDKGVRLHREGYNCAQSVLMAFSDATGVSDENSACIAAALGAGVASGEICGVPNAMAIAEGMITADSTSSGKKRVMPKAKALINEFASPFNGCLTCRDLKGKCGKPCDELIARGIQILHDSL